MVQHVHLGRRQWQPTPALLGQSIGASASVLPINIQDWFPWGLAGFISLLSKGLSRDHLIFHSFFFFFWRFFWQGPFIKSLVNLLQYCLFYVFVFWPWAMWDLSSLSRDQTHTPCIGRWSLHHWTAREVPYYRVFKKKKKITNLCYR